MNKTFRGLVFLSSLLMCLFISCNQDDSIVSDTSNEMHTMDYSPSVTTRNQDMVAFVKILSRSLSQNEKLRTFIKKEALRMFDKNYDFLYYPLRNEKVDGNLSFRDILVANSSEKEMSVIDKNLPLLNILIPRIAFLNVFPENLDTRDAEIPVAIENNDNGTDLYIRGQKVDEFADNEFPGFNVIVVNLNTRVSATKALSTRGTSGNLWSYNFKSKNYNGNIQTRSNNFSFDHSQMPSYLYKKAEKAFDEGFNQDNNSINQIAFQRDNIYYGMTPTKTTGELNRSVTEYLSYMIVDPKVYTKISDEQSNHINDDPYIKENSITNKKNPLSHDDAIRKMWTEGAYNFIFEISSSNSKESAKMPIPVFPEEIWNFNIKRSFKKGGLFHRDQYKYEIDPTKFTSKIYYFDPATVTFGKWDIANESLVRYISIYEEDSGDDVTETSTESFTHVQSTNFKGDIKIGLGLGNIGNKQATGEADFSSQTNSSNTITTTNTITIKRHQGDDLLGYKIPIYFYDPIIVSTNNFSTSNEGDGHFGGGHQFGGGGHFGGGHQFGGGDHFGNRSPSLSGNRSWGNYQGNNGTNPSKSKYVVHEYNTGSIRFGIDVR